MWLLRKHLAMQNSVNTQRMAKKVTEDPVKVADASNLLQLLTMSLRISDSFL